MSNDLVAFRSHGAVATDIAWAPMCNWAALTLQLLLVLCVQTMAECSGNLVSDNLMAAPVAETALKTTALKVVMVCVSTCLDQFPQPQAVLMFLCPCLSAYFQVRSVGRHAVVG